MEASNLRERLRTPPLTVPASIRWAPCTSNTMRPEWLSHHYPTFSELMDLHHAFSLATLLTFRARKYLLWERSCEQCSWPLPTPHPPRHPNGCDNQKRLQTWTNVPWLGTTVYTPTAASFKTKKTLCASLKEQIIIYTAVLPSPSPAKNKPQFNPVSRFDYGKYQKQQKS